MIDTYALFHTTDSGRRMVGKLVASDGLLTVVSDYLGGILEGELDGKSLNDPKVQSLLRFYQESPYHGLVHKHSSEILRPPAPQGRPAVVSDANATEHAYQYRRGNSPPHTLVIRNDNQILLDGTPLNLAEASVIVQTIESKEATMTPLQKHQSVDDILRLAASDSGEPEKLAKYEDLNSAFARLRQAVVEGAVSPKDFDIIRREMFADEMVPEIGNKKAFRDFMISDERIGTHIIMDANGLKAINDSKGHAAGDLAIRLLGKAIRNALDKSVGADKSKAHRIGGDEFHVFVPTSEQADAFLGALQQELEASKAPEQGVSRLSLSAGVGLNPEQADEAMYQAKQNEGLMDGFKKVLYVKKAV